MSAKKADQGTSSMEAMEKGLFEGLIESLANKHSQLDLNFQSTSIRFPGTQMGVELNGVVTLTVHLRELTEDEKQASATKNVALMAAPTR
ncbi:MAG: hypothetical protein ACREBS_11215 [Nitrososphaerales archaeon]